MALFDSPNDLQWNGQIDTFKRSSNETFIGRIVDERGDGNYNDNIFQKYTVELLGWGQRVYNVKVKVSDAGYNGTGDYVNYKVNDVVILQAKEGQLDEAVITGSMRLNGSFQKLEVEGQGQINGEHYVGPRQRKAASNPPAVHPARITKVDSKFFIGGVNNAQSSFEDPTELGNLEDSLNKQPLPGVLKYVTKEGVDVNYSYGGSLHMTDGNVVILSSGTRQNKCTKYLEQAERHTKIASYINKLGFFTQNSNIRSNEIQEAVEDAEVDLTKPIGEGGNLSITEDTPLYASTQGQPANLPTEQLLEAGEALSRSGTSFEAKEAKEAKDDKIFGNLSNTAQEVGKYGMAILSSGSFRSRKHEELAEIARKQAEECNAIGAAYQYSSLLMNNSAVMPSISSSATSPSQGIGHVDPNNFSSRNGGDPKPPTQSKPAHPTNYSNKNHSIKYLVLHHSASTMESMTTSFQTPNFNASAHYAVGRDGLVVQYIPDNKVAWHVKSQNTGKIGIEIVATRPNQGMTVDQEASLIKLARYIKSTYNIPLENIRGHNQFMATQCPTWIFPTAESLKNWATTYLS